jgi:hypothetical protein
MNYQMSLVAILASYVITFNAWADCCFIKPPVNLPPSTYPCITTANFDACNDTPNRVGYLNDNASCSIDGYTCCVQGETGFIIEEGTLVPVETPPDCEPDTKAIRLPVIIDEFTATLKSHGEVSLKGAVTNLGEKAHLNLWRAQIAEGNHGDQVTKPKKINKMPIKIAGDLHETVEFWETDANPLSGVNYYVLTDRAMNGELTIHCDDIQSVVVGEGTPNPDLAKELCEGVALSLLLRVFKP